MNAAARKACDVIGLPCILLTGASLGVAFIIDLVVAILIKVASRRVGQPLLTLGHALERR